MRGLALVACVVTAACGSDSRPSKIVPEQAAAMVRTMAQFRATMATNDGFAVASATRAIGGQGAAIVQPDEQGGQVRPAPPVVFAVGTCQCSEAGCTFTGCGDDAGQWTLDGTIAINAGVYTFDLSWAMDTGDGITETWTYDGALTMSDTSIDGELAGRGRLAISDPDGETVEIDMNWDVDFLPAMIDSVGCAIGGKLHVDGEIEERTRIGNFRWAKAGTVAFGPTCGEAVLD